MENIINVNVNIERKYIEKFYLKICHDKTCLLRWLLLILKFGKLDAHFKWSLNLKACLRINDTWPYKTTLDFNLGDDTYPRKIKLIKPLHYQLNLVLKGTHDKVLLIIFSNYQISQMLFFINGTVSFHLLYFPTSQCFFFFLFQKYLILEKIFLFFCIFFYLHANFRYKSEVRFPEFISKIASKKIKIKLLQNSGRSRGGVPNKKKSRSIHKN